MGRKKRSSIGGLRKNFSYSPLYDERGVEAFLGSGPVDCRKNKLTRLKGGKGGKKVGKGIRNHILPKAKSHFCLVLKKRRFVGAGRRWRAGERVESNCHSQSRGIRKGPVT